LARSPHATGLPGILDLTGRGLTAEQVGAEVVAGLVRETGWEVVAGDWTDAELRAVDDLAATKYGGESWNRKR
jgi:hypothetical protein